MNKVWAPYSLDECCIFPYRTQMNTVCISEIYRVIVKSECYQKWETPVERYAEDETMELSIRLARLTL